MDGFMKGKKDEMIFGVNSTKNLVMTYPVFFCQLTVQVKRFRLHMRWRSLKHHIKKLVIVFFTSFFSFYLSLNTGRRSCYPWPSDGRVSEDM